MNIRYRQRRLSALRFKQATANRARLSLTDPQFNLREVAKQMVLLEDHLCHPHKHCPDCICKHLLTIEAFAEEAVSLDTAGMYRDVAESIAIAARTWLEEFADGRPPAEMSQALRALRKVLVSQVADPRGALVRVAARYQASHYPCIHQSCPPEG